mmetsp:Transcript_6466/g.18499  ORF Transcript_6466/g.18499 Transcript_6466/m.18499 type:complete len:2786 (-) Transcript_6466:82-8439(-)|eukprot:CAMPEP_0172363078 /NCGR_PEP_ID=MMETSP1060-20121228/6529_1 /TAXON_ID=37318 /ORGANISM="Pseudo-nitzschia pungens, Strain cf. cingulata" /LENGTH=2785 /DNA_ID=CAMNT_0013085737 /DNA_START=2452 /DNA_END=10809 /DNA_ORIENTATION=+
MAGDDQSVDGSAGGMSLIDLISDLASSRPDSVSEDERESLVENATELLSEDAENRRVLADHEVFKCAGKFSNQRIARLYCVAIVNEKDDADVRKQLCLSLCALLKKCSNGKIVEDCKRQLGGSGADIFAEMAKANESSLGIPSLVFAETTDWDLFVTIALNTEPVATIGDAKLCRSILESMTATAWEDVVGAPLLLKLKAKPESLLPMVEGFMRFANLVALGSSKLVVEEYLPVLCKFLKSPKARVRELSSTVLQHMAGAAIDQQNLEGLSKIVDSVAETKGLTLPHQRQIVYHTLHQIGLKITTAPAGSIKVNKSTSSAVLSGVGVPLAKEAKAAVQNREQGLQALISWIVIARKNGVGSGDKGYDDALKFVRKPVIAKNGPDTVETVGAMVQQINPDTMENIVLDLWKDPKFVKGLEAFIEQANKKQASSSSIAPVDGLLAVYLNLVHVGVSSSKLSPLLEKALSAGSLSVGKTSFVYGKAITNVVSSNAVVGLVLPQIISMFTKIASNANIKVGKMKATSSNVRALAHCTAYPVAMGKKSPSDSIEATIRTVLDYESIADPLVEALFVCVNEQFAEAGSDCTVCVKTVRQIARMLSTRSLSASSVAKVLILMHLGTSQELEEEELTALVESTATALKAVVEASSSQTDEFVATFPQVVAEQAAGDRYSDKDIAISESIHMASQSLVFSLGKAPAELSDSDPDLWDLVMTLLDDGISKKLAENLVSITREIEELSGNDIAIYSSPIGTLYVEEDSDQKKKIPSKDSGKGRRTEDEEWELQIKKELAKKKSEAAGKSSALSAEDKKMVKAQDEKRSNIACLIEVKYQRLLTTIESLVSADGVEVGNSCLPSLWPAVLQLSILDCPAMNDLTHIKEQATKTLTSLVAACVWEIEEEYAPMVATALVISSKNSPKSETKESEKSPDLSTKFQVLPFPTPCEPAANAVFEMDEFREEIMSGPSFAFLFPIIRAALMGPRTVPGCEGALRVLERHTTLLTDGDPAVKPLRADMVASVLELLKHDRAKAFVDPDPYETLLACYYTDEDEDQDKKTSGPAFTTAELAPLLDERGALGEKKCRVASMIALGSIASNHEKIVKNNPLIENRIWLNCFEEDESIRAEARKTWNIVNGLDETNEALPPPSAMYAIPLLPLLHSSDASIAAAAAKAYAFGMKAHPKSLNRNLKKVCNLYIDSYPQPEGAGNKSSGSGVSAPKASFPTPAPPPKPKPLVPAKLKKKTVKKSALQVAGIGQSKKKVSKKTKAMTSAMLKPKQERTLDQAALEDQFKTGPKTTPAEQDTSEKVSIRSGVLRVLAAFPTADFKIDNDTLKLVTSFLMAYGIADGNESVKNTSRNALRDIIVTYGSSEEAIAFLLPHLDDILKNGLADSKSLDDLPTTKIAANTDALNRRKEGAVVALGSVALHLKGPENASKIDNSVDMLISSLKTPNEDVQASVADALTKLMKKGNTQARIQEILDQLVSVCLEGDSQATRHGGAYGIAAAVKGSGIASLKKFGIVTQLEEACADGSSSNKEGSLFAIQLLCTRLGLLFEPYVIVLLPSLLKAFGDGSEEVRKAASKAVGVIMSKLSAHGVKLVLPAVLSAFNDSSWRTKQASIDMLGSMSHLAPKQLASALPKVVPKLTEAFADTHPKVKGSAQSALDEISSVIRNPEIREISPRLLKALTDPANKTLFALEALIETEFLHAIDAPSLALIVPILHRGLRDRAATTKRYGALITGNICTMINDPRDFIPYIPTLMPDLKSSLLDPIPDVRSIAAKALGSLTRGLGEDSLPDLRPWLLEHLRLEDLSSAERSGAAQGLTEVLIASGNDVVESLMLDDILPLSSHPSHSTREGVLWVLCFLPPAMGQGFTVMLDESLPALISGLSDENEQVRDVAMKAGRVLIRSHGKVHFDKILPILQHGMTDEDNRIRLSSLMLLGDLLSMIGGTTLLRTDGDTQDDIRRAERAQVQITQVLGITTRNRVLSDIYLARSDNASAVRHAAVQVWKTVVSVTARTLRQILQVLVSRVVSDLASGDAEKTDTAGKCLGDIVRKLGDSVLPEVVPVLRNTLYEGDHNTRRGVCVGLSEVISSSTKDQIIRFLDIIVKVVQDAICDDNEGVREMAAASFQNLYNLVGNTAMDEVVPSLMVALESEDEDRSERAMHGLTGILSIRSKELLSYIIPRLIQQPMTICHAKAIASIATVTSETLYFHFNTIIPALLEDLSNGLSDDEDQIEAVRDCARSVFEHADEAGVNKLISEVGKNCTSDKAELRKESCWMLGAVVEARKEAKDFYDLNSIIIRDLIHRFNDENKDVVQTANKAFAALSKCVPAEVLVDDIEYMRNIIASMVSDARRRKGGVGDGEFFLPGFNIKKGLEPLLPIYQRGILYGTPAVREASAAGLGEVINLTANKFLAGPLIIKMTGPLLRIVGDRNPANVKIAILKTLGLILVKGGPALRAFVPQFQTTFVKALSDPSRQVRIEAIGALGLLMPLSTRVDPLIKELVAGSLGKDNGGEDGVGVVAVQTATLEALAVVLSKGGKKSKLPDSIPSALEASTSLIRHSDESVREAAAKVTGAACNILGTEKTEDAIRDIVLDDDDDDDSSDVREGKACALRRIFSTDVAKNVDAPLKSESLDVAMKYMNDEKLAVKESGIVAVGAIVGRSEDPEASLRNVEKDLVSLMVGDLKQRLETHQAIARCLCLSLELSDVDSRVAFFGLKLLKACIKLAMSGNQRVQFAYNDVLWVALNVSEGEAGLDEFCSMAMFEDSKQMKSLYSKVLLKIQKAKILED